MHGQRLLCGDDGPGGAHARRWTPRPPTWPMRRRRATGPSASSSAPCCWGPMRLDSQLGETVNNYGLLGGDRLSMAQGALQQTGNPLDLAIEGQGFFMVQTPNGLALYARRQLSPRAEAASLVTEAGEPVLSAAGQPIAIPPGEVSVGADGALSVAGGVVARVGVFTFPAGTDLTPEGANRYVAPAGVTAALRQGCHGAPGSARGRQSGCGRRVARSDRDAAPGGDDAEGADGLSYRVQQVCHRRSAQGVERVIDRAGYARTEEKE